MPPACNARGVTQMPTRVANHSPDHEEHVYQKVAGTMLNTLGASKLSTIPVPKPRRAMGISGQLKALSVEWHPDSKHLVACYQGGSVILWHVISGRPVQYVQRPFVTSLAILPLPGQEKTLVGMGGLDNSIALYDMTPSNDSMAEVEQVLPPVHDGVVKGLAFLSTETLASASGDGDVRLWNTSTGGCTQVLRGHEKDVTSLTIPMAMNDAPAPHVFATTSFDKTVRMWDARCGKTTHIFQCESEPGKVGFFPTGNCFATGCDDGIVRIFDVRSYATIGQIVTELPRVTGTQVRCWSEGVQTERGKSARAFIEHTAPIHQRSNSPPNLSPMPLLHSSHALVERCTPRTREGS